MNYDVERLRKTVSGLSRDEQQILHLACLEACQAVSKAYRDDFTHLRDNAHKLTESARAKYVPRLKALQAVESALVMNNPDTATFHIPGAKAEPTDSGE